MRIGEVGAVLHTQTQVMGAVLHTDSLCVIVHHTCVGGGAQACEHVIMLLGTVVQV